MADEEPLYPTFTIRFVTGDHYPIGGSLPIQIVDPDPDSPDPDNPIMVPRNLMGWSAIAQIRQTTRPNAELIAMFTITGLGEDGFLYLDLPPAETRKVTRECGWDLQLTDPSGNPETILGGPVIPEGDYSR